MKYEIISFAVPAQPLVPYQGRYISLSWQFEKTARLLI
jgi:hypothetical protein